MALWWRVGACYTKLALCETFTCGAVDGLPAHKLFLSYVIFGVHTLSLDNVTLCLLPSSRGSDHQQCWLVRAVPVDLLGRLGPATGTPGVVGYYYTRRCHIMLSDDLIVGGLNWSCYFKW
jgi:hypothetical protein